MMQITEDTPPDMLAGAMDLTVHLPTGRTVKMSVDRSTPMMDLLVQITTAHHLQQSGHTLQALEMAPSSGHMDRILPYKPNTPIGVLDTQHVKVFPKNRSTSIHKSVSTGHQPFESTFRLQVHLPRNQLYVIRVSQNVHLEDIMKKVCHEKNLDSTKYECRHPGNLNEVLDPKLTLSDYQITEVYIVFKGTVGLTQAFSANDIMALRKEEERKQLQARTGGGVFSLIFKRGKQSTGSGSLSSENRSISPSHSDDSRSVTPPAIQQQILSARTQDKSPLKDKPKAPQRKRRPAPKPPQQSEDVKDLTEKPLSQISNISDTNTSDIHPKKFDSGLTICHSRNSSDSSGYHEPSVLSENCNTSLPRRPKSTLINEVVDEEVQFGENSQNLTKMSAFSKSTSSITSRKKKAAPPPPQIQTPVPELTVANIESASTVVANVIVEKQEEENKAAVADSDINVATSSSSDIPVNIIKSKLDSSINNSNSLETFNTKDKNKACTSRNTDTKQNEINQNSKPVSNIKENLLGGESKNIDDKSKLFTRNTNTTKLVGTNKGETLPPRKTRLQITPEDLTSSKVFKNKMNSYDYSQKLIDDANFNQFVETVDLFFGARKGELV